MPRVYLAGPPFAEEYRRRASPLARGRVYTGGTPPHPWTAYVAESLHADLGDAVAAL